mgnify:CR=1 FL=1
MHIEEMIEALREQGHEVRVVAPLADQGEGQMGGGVGWVHRLKAVLPRALVPALSHHWEIAVLYGPHGAPDFFTDGDIASFLESEWQVHYNSNRTGVRLVGPKPEWARRDGGVECAHVSVPGLI